MLIKRLFISFGIAVLYLIIPRETKAQAPDTVLITGQVVDSAFRPLQWATVSVVKKDTSIYTTATNEKGTFSLRIQKVPDLVVKITSASYEAAVKTIVYDSVVNGKTDLGPIRLQQRTGELQGVTVTATAPLIRQEIDKLVYNMEADPESKFRSVLDIMRKVPYLSVDGQENLLLKGNSSYRILINGKPSGIVDNNPREFLKSLPASTILRIEVYTTPPSKYDAEGLAGVINIITNKKVGEGYKGSVTVSERFPAGGPSGGFSFTGTHKKWGVELYGGVNGTHNPWENSASIRNTFEQDPTRLNISVRAKHNTRGRYTGTQFSYEIDSLQLLTAQLNFNGSSSNGSIFRFSQLVQNNTVYRQFRQTAATRNDDNGFDGGLNYQRSFKKDKSKLLTLSYQYRRYKTRKSGTNLFADTVNYPSPDFIQYNNPLFTEHTGQVDYVQTLKKIKAEAGIKAIFRQNNSNFRTALWDIAEDAYIEDPEQQDIFENRQTILAAYNTYAFSLKKWGFKAGIRAEETINNIRFRSTQTSVHNEYFNLVPSIAINKENRDGSYLNWGYNQRLKRPGIYRMNPFINRSNPNFIEQGNPDLQSTTMHNFSLGYGINKKQSVNIGLSYAFINNMDLKNSRYDTLTKITYITYGNSGNVKAIMANISANLAVTKALRTVVNGHIAQFWIELQEGEQVNSLKPVLYNGSVTNTYTFKNNWIANAAVFIYGRNLANAQAQGYIKGYIATSFSVSRSFIKNKLTLSAFADNPFTKFRNNEVEITSYNFVEINTNQQYFRRFGFSAAYNFGKLKKDIRKNKRSISNNDLSN